MLVLRDAHHLQVLLLKSQRQLVVINTGRCSNIKRCRASHP